MRKRLAKDLADLIKEVTTREMQGGREKCTVQFLKCVPDIDPYIMADSMSDL